MKKMKIILLIIVSFSCISILARSNKSCVKKTDQEVEKIDKSNLKEAIFTNFESNYRIDSLRFNDVLEDMSIIYADTELRIRKLVNLWNYPETQGYVVHYFEPTGGVIYSELYENGYLNPSPRGVRYMNQGRQFYCNMKFYGESGELISDSTYFNGERCSTGIVCFDAILHVDSIAIYCLKTHQEALPATPENTQTKEMEITGDNSATSHASLFATKYITTANPDSENQFIEDAFDWFARVDFAMVRPIPTENGIDGSAGLTTNGVVMALIQTYQDTLDDDDWNKTEVITLDHAMQFINIYLDSPNASEPHEVISAAYEWFGQIDFTFPPIPPVANNIQLLTPTPTINVNNARLMPLPSPPAIENN